MKRILITAYDINPYRGSESATGWNFVWQASRLNQVVAITRLNNREHIERYIGEHSLDVTNIDFIYYDLPYILRFWKKGSRGALFYFYLWQMSIPFLVWGDRYEFDIVHSLNFHADWTPSFLWVLGRPFVWGPINHNEPIPKKYIKTSVFFKDRLKFILKLLFWNLDPFLYICKKKAKVILCGNRSVVKRLRILGEKAVILSQVGVDLPIVINSRKSVAKSFTVLTAGRMIDIKSFDLAIKAFSKFLKRTSLHNVDIKLLLVGNGELFPALQDLAIELGIQNNLIFTGWVEKVQMPIYYSEADVFLFTSHEGAGMVVAEAQSYGVPVICFNNYGPGETVTDISSIRVPYRDYHASITDFSEALEKLYLDRNYLNSLSNGAIELSMAQSWDSKGNAIAEVYEQI